MTFKELKEAKEAAFARKAAATLLVEKNDEREIRKADRALARAAK